MFRKQFHLIGILVILALLLSSCGGDTSTGGQNGASTASPTAGAAGVPTEAAPAAGNATSAPEATGTSAPAAAQGTATLGTGGGATGNPVAIKVFAQQGTTYNLADNAFTHEMEQRFNIKFNWQTTTWDNTAAGEARQIQLASGDYPDLYLLIPWVDQFKQAELLKYGKQGLLTPLNDLIAQYAPNIQAVFQQNPEFKAISTAPDGKIYGLTQLIDCYHCEHTLQMYINTAWLDKLGLKMPTTTDEFRTVLQAFKTKDPNGNGKADEIPLTGNSQFLSMSPFPVLLESFLYYSGNDRNKVPLILNAGKADTAANKPEYKQGLQYVASLYKDGLIDQGAFSQNLDAMKKLGNNPGTEIVGAAPTAWGSITTDKERGKDYNPVPPLKGPGGAQYAFWGSSIAPGATFVLTNKASKDAQIAAIKMLDYMFSTNGATRAIFGVEGKDWRGPQPGDVAVNPKAQPLYATIPAATGAKPPNDSWGPLGQYLNTRAFRDAQIVGTDIYAPGNEARRLQQATDLYAPAVPKDKIFPEWNLWPDPTAADEQAQLQTNLGNYIQQNTLQFITGAKSLDKDWDAYVKGLDQLNLSRYLQIEQQEYDTYLKTQQK